MGQGHKYTTARKFFSCAITIPASSGAFTSLYDLAIAGLNSTTDKTALLQLKESAIIFKLAKKKGGTLEAYDVRVGDTTSGMNTSAQTFEKAADEELSSAEFTTDGPGMQTIYVRASADAAIAAACWWGCASVPIKPRT